MYETSKSDRDFEDAFGKMKANFEKALYRNSMLDKHVDQLRSQISNTLSNNFNQFADGLSKSKSKYAKLASDGIKAF
jgi:hypothetical protein